MYWFSHYFEYNEDLLILEANLSHFDSVVLPPFSSSKWSVQVSALYHISWHDFCLWKLDSPHWSTCSTQTVRLLVGSPVSQCDSVDLCNFALFTRKGCRSTVPCLFFLLWSLLGGWTDISQTAYLLLLSRHITAFSPIHRWCATFAIPLFY